MNRVAGQEPIEQLGQLVHMAHAFVRLPTLHDAVIAGRLDWTRARQVAAVATEATVAHWIKIAERSSRRDLVRGIRAARLQARRAPEES